MSARAAASSSESFRPATMAFSLRSSSRPRSASSGASRAAPALVLFPRTDARRASSRSWYLFRVRSDVASERAGEGGAPRAGPSWADSAIASWSSCARSAAPFACFLRLYSSSFFLPLARSLALRSIAPPASIAGGRTRSGARAPRTGTLGTFGKDENVPNVRLGTKKVERRARPMSNFFFSLFENTPLTDLSVRVNKGRDVQARDLLVCKIRACRTREMSHAADEHPNGRPSRSAPRASLTPDRAATSPPGASRARFGNAGDAGTA